MADSSITDLPNSLTSATIEEDDLFGVDDISATETKKITKKNLRNGLPGGTTALTDQANIATDLSLGEVHTVTLGGNRTLDNPTNKVVGQIHDWVITQDGGGTNTLAFGTDYDFQGDDFIDLTASSVTVIRGRVASSSSIICEILDRGPGKQYASTGGAGDFTVTGSLSSAAATLTVFQSDAGGDWVIEGDIEAVRSAGSNTPTITISGITFKTGVDQAVWLQGVGSSGTQTCLANGGLATITGNFLGGAPTALSWHIRCRLDSKPTWAD